MVLTEVGFVFVCSHGRVCTNYNYGSTPCMWLECTSCFESCGNMETECCCCCVGGSQEAELPLLFIMTLIFLVLVAVFGIFYSVLVATMVGQRIWQRHYHILAKRMLTKVHLTYFFCLFSFGSIVDSLQLVSQLKYLAVCATDPFSDLYPSE